MSDVAAIRQTVDQLGHAFEEFKAAKDESLQEIRKTGETFPETRAKVDSLNEAIDTLKTQAETILSRQDNFEVKLNRRGLGAGGDDEIKAKSAARFFSMVRKKRVRASEVDIEAYDKYCEAFEEVMRCNMNLDMLPTDIRAAASVGSDTDGGFFVPAEMSMEIERRIFDTSPMRSRATVIMIGTDAWEAPYQSADATSGGWVGEIAARTTTATPARGMQRIPVHEQYAFPEATQQVLDDATVDMAAILTQEASDVMSRTENTAFVTGNGVGRPRGFADYGAASVTTADASRAWGVLQYIASGAAGAWPDTGGSLPDNANALIDTVTALNPGYRQGASWAMNRSTEAGVRKLKDGDGRYLVGFGDLRDNAFGFSLLGFPIDNFEDMADVAADSYSIALANWARGYYIIDRIGLRILRDPYTNKPYVGFYMTKRVGGDVRNFDAVKLIKFAAS